MRLLYLEAVLFPLASLLLVIRAPAVIVDGVAITVGTSVITRSEIELRIRLIAFQNGEKLDFSFRARQQAAQRLIDQKLVEHEMDVGRYPRVDAKAKEGLLADYAKANYKSDTGAMATALKAYGLSVQDLEDELGLQTDLLTFLNLRFRPAVQVTEEDIRKYFTEHYTQGPEKTKQQAQAGALNEVRAQIEQQLTMERSNKELDSWLQDQRKRVGIVYVEKDLAPDKQGKQDQTGK
jgi:hypothetical protein